MRFSNNSAWNRHANIRRLVVSIRRNTYVYVLTTEQVGIILMSMDLLRLNSRINECFILNIAATVALFLLYVAINIHVHRKREKHTSTIV